MTHYLKCRKKSEIGNGDDDEKVVMERLSYLSVQQAVDRTL